LNCPDEVVANAAHALERIKVVGEFSRNQKDLFEKLGSSGIGLTHNMGFDPDKQEKAKRTVRKKNTQQAWPPK
jgi:hypothetical protein